MQLTLEDLSWSKPARNRAKFRGLRCRNNGNVIDRAFLTDELSTVETAVVLSKKKNYNNKIKKKKYKEGRLNLCVTFLVDG